MRRGVDKERLLAFMREIGKRAQGPGRVYLAGGSTALLLGIRPQTIDIDIKLDPEPKMIFEAIAAIKEDLSLNVELASPDDFLPPLPGWRERSEFIDAVGQVEFYHYDFYAQALSKIHRGHGQDLTDAQALVALGKVDPAVLARLYDQIEPDVIRYPAVNSRSLRRALADFVKGSANEAG